MGYYFGLWARCLSDELKKKICNDRPVASSGEKKRHLSRWEANHMWGAQEVGNTHRADLRLGGSVAVAVVMTVAVLLQLRANNRTLKHRRADSSRPLER